MIVFLVAALLFVLLVWAGRRPSWPTGAARLAAAGFAAIAALGAVVSAVRGGWILSLCLMGLSVWIGQGLRRRARAVQPNVMSLHEAREMLGVSEGAERAEILLAYRRLMRIAHPDHGGSTGLAAQLNAARDRLLDKRGGV
jgi:hypothetical protein